MRRFWLLLAMSCGVAPASTLFSINLGTTTTLLDGSNFTTGTTYYSAFQLTGGDASNGSAAL